MASPFQESFSRYVRAPYERPSITSTMSLEEVPVVDMSKLHQEDELAKLDKTCKEWGFFQVTGHDIELENTLQTMRGFFDFTQQEKEAYSVSKSATREGYGRFFSLSEDEPLDWEETLIHKLPPVGIPWPSCSGYKEVVGEYAGKLRNLADKLLGAMSKALKQEEHFLSNAFGDANQFLRLNYYPPCPQPELVLGLTPHSDGSGITILLQDEDVEGLQIMKDGEWKLVKPVSNALVVNVGDAMEILSGQIYKSVVHRAIVNSKNARFSAALFHCPGSETVIKPLINDRGLFIAKTMGELQKEYFNGRLSGKGLMQYALKQQYI